MKRRNVKRLMALLLSTALLLSGCGSSTAKSAEETTTEAEATGEADTATEENSGSGGVVKMA